MEPPRRQVCRPCCQARSSAPPELPPPPALPSSLPGSGTALREAVLMEQRVSLVTLGVTDLARARQFYTSLGWRPATSPADDVVFFQAGGMVLGLWDRAMLAHDSAVQDLGGWGGVPLAYNVRAPPELDGASDQARRACAACGLARSAA